MVLDLCMEQVWRRRKDASSFVGEGCCGPRVMLTSFWCRMCCRTVYVGLIPGFLLRCMAAWFCLRFSVSLCVFDALLYLICRWLLSLNQSWAFREDRILHHFVTGIDVACEDNFCFTCEDTEPGIRFLYDIIMIQHWLDLHYIHLIYTY